jgi:1-acyl-sn-glycerol-3-phosphate acyltransferase
MSAPEYPQAPRPDVRLHNINPLYSYYDELQPSAFAQKALLAVSAGIYRPQISYDDGAAERIKALTKEGSSLLMASNHINIFDQNAIAAVVYSQPAFQDVIGNTFVPAKVPYFLRPRLRSLMEMVGAVPVVRAQDVEGIDDGISMQAKAALRLIKTCSKKLEKGQHMFIFPEGTRNKGDLRELGKINKGIGRIACGVKDRDIAIVPMGLWYGDDPKFADTLRPNLHVGTPIEGSFENPNQVLSLLRGAMRHCLDEVTADKEV